MSRWAMAGAIWALGDIITANFMFTDGRMFGGVCVMVMAFFMTVYMLMVWDDK